MIDTHTHLYLGESFPGDEGREAVERALASGVTRFMMPNIDGGSIGELVAMCERYPGVVTGAVGLHPTEVRDDWREVVRGLEPYLDRPDMRAVGEVGVDLYWDKSLREQQIEAFDYQLDLADRKGLTVIIHQREALDEVLGVVSNHAASLSRLVFHCFTGDVEDVRRIRSVAPEAYFGIGGVVTFRSAKELRNALGEIGLDRILLETDSPYLAPVPMRGKRNESSYLGYVAECVAGVLGVDVAKVDEVSSLSASKLFGL